MSHGPEHHLEEAKEAQHARHDPFDKRVAMTMAIMAACLACVSMASHRGHNEAMSEQMEANNRWSYQNTKKTRFHLYDLFREVVPVLGTSPEAAAVAGKFKQVADKEDQDARKEQATAEDHVAAAQRAHEQTLFYDSGALGLELGLVLCSVAVLSRFRFFWVSGVAVSIVGIAVAVYGLTLALRPVTPPATTMLHGPAAASWPQQMS
jgi:hypothetical protein